MCGSYYPLNRVAGQVAVHEGVTMTRAPMSLGPHVKYPVCAPVNVMSTWP